MNRRYFALILAGIANFSLVGCATRQLQCQTVRQAETLNEVYEQQILDNLAMFAVNGHAIPHFAYPNEGGTDVADAVGAEAGPPLNPFFTTIGLSGGRDSSHSWVLTPVVNPKSLSLMQQAYQRSLGIPVDSCKNWCKDLNDFRGEDSYQCPDCDIRCGWVCVSDCKKDVPKCCGTRYGEYCGTYVWVQEGYEHEFSRLVMFILELAVNEPAEIVEVEETKRLKFFIDKNGNPVQEKEAVGTLEVEMPKDAAVGTAIILSVEEANEREEALSKTLATLESDLIAAERLAPNDTTGIQQLENFDLLNAPQTPADAKKAIREKISDVKEELQEIPRVIESLQSQTGGRTILIQPSRLREGSGILRLDQRERYLQPQRVR